MWLHYIQRCSAALKKPPPAKKQDASSTFSNTSSEEETPEKKTPPHRKITKRDLLPRPYTSTPVGRIRKVPPGTRALAEIRQYQRSTELLLPKLSFCRVVCVRSLLLLLSNSGERLTVCSQVREIANRRNKPDVESYKWERNALLAVQHAAENYVVCTPSYQNFGEELTCFTQVQLFIEACKCAISANRKTVMISDFYLARRIRGAKREALW